jgi:hypothetical protein
LNGAKGFFNLKNYVKVRKKLVIKRIELKASTYKTPNKFYNVKTKTEDSLQKEEQFSCQNQDQRLSYQGRMAQHWMKHR